ncbi:MAG: hypothetical protein M0R17_06110 [Candidatus Omnitrophica bacterium]|jgi:hypothetical protein|nr:hypothetical protein [Candidatus Omnitrophota bacterium]
MSDDNLTEESAKELVRQMESENKTIPAFFKDVVMSEDTTKTGNLNQEELGLPDLTLRGYKDLEVLCRDLLEDECAADYFKHLAENVILAPSLSKDAILLKLVVTKKSEVSDMTPRRKVNKGWFKKDKEE